MKKYPFLISNEELVIDNFIFKAYFSVHHLFKGHWEPFSLVMKKICKGGVIIVQNIKKKQKFSSKGDLKTWKKSYASLPQHEIWTPPDSFITTDEPIIVCQCLSLRKGSKRE